MANQLLTIDLITREAVRLFRNSNAFIMNINRDYSDQFARVGAKIGDTLRIRLPNDYTVSDGPALQVQDTAEVFTQLTLSTQRHVDVAFSSAERTMELDDYSTRILAPAINNLGGNVAYAIMSGIDSQAGCCNFVANKDNNGAVLTPTLETWAMAGAILRQQGAPLMNWKAVLDPVTMARTMSSVSGLLNPATEISRQYMTGQVFNAVGYDWMNDQTVINHVTGAYVGSGSPAYVVTTVNGGGQSGTTLVVNATSGPVNAGDIIEIEDVFGVNRTTKQSYGTLRQFVVTANALTGATSLSIYPALTPAVGGVEVQYQTVDASPINGADVSAVTLSGTRYRKNLVFSPEAITMATADLELPNGVTDVARAVFDGLSLRILSDYINLTDKVATRTDVLFGYKYVRPEWVVAVADSNT